MAPWCETMRPLVNGGGRGIIARTRAARFTMTLHPTRRRGESVRGLVYGTLLGILIWLAVGVALLLLL